MSFLLRSATRMYTFDYSHDFSEKKQSRVVQIQSLDQWKTYFDASKRNNRLLVVQFTSTWCGPCKFIDPSVQEFAATFTDVDFIKIDVDRLPSVAQLFEANILPTFVLIKQGKQVDKIVGVKKMDLQNKIEQHRM